MPTNKIVGKATDKVMFVRLCKCKFKCDCWGFLQDIVGSLPCSIKSFEATVVVIWPKLN